MKLFYKLYFFILFKLKNLLEKRKEQLVIEILRICDEPEEHENDNIRLEKLIKRLSNVDKRLKSLVVNGTN